MDRTFLYEMQENLFKMRDPLRQAIALQQQARFDAFRKDFNENRPHEALGQVPPPSRYRASPRPYPAKIEEFWYDADHAVRRVRSSGEIKWGGDLDLGLIR